MTLALCLTFLLSGAAALLFETLWFRLAGLAFGNSVWASSLVLASFMAGLALGNFLAAWRGQRLGRPLRAYAFLEGIIGLTGLGLVFLLPVLTGVLAPIFRPFAESAWALNTLRLGAAFVLLLVPATAMGATLPVLVKALSRDDANFGRVLGRLYAWNTLGAVLGAWAGEGFLIGRLGLRGTGLVAALLDGAAALCALLLSRRRGETFATGRAPAGPALDASASRVLLAAFLSGGLLLALEVVWFRFLQLFLKGTAVAFAVMLSVVLAGIAAGGFAASRWLGRRPGANRFAPHLALAAGFTTIWRYGAFPYAGQFVGDQAHTALFSLSLMFPVCVASGALFTLLGQALKDVVADQTRTAGALTLANTVGATAGAILAGSVLLPRVGMEGSLFGLAAAYGLVALLVADAGTLARPRERGQSLLLAAGAAVYLLAVVAFPFGLMRNHFVPRVARRHMGDGSKIVAVREGLTETIIYLRKDLWGQPYYHRLLTNGFSMSGNGPMGRRYMKLFVYWPLMVHPEAKSALLISYGVGSTAKALTDSAGLDSIDVVDISRDILDISPVVFPRPADNPLADRRVSVHVEDGRYFLQTTVRRYDVITAEPPPPKNAGIVNLYSLEYFRLIHDRLAPGGVATYWLPVGDLTASDALAITKAFCSAFEDCSLWTGTALDWMLAGTRGGRARPVEADFARQWRDPAVGAELRTLGFETPEQIGALFLGDADFLRGLTRNQEPLVDDFPYRLSPVSAEAFDPLFPPLLATSGARERFLRSAYVRDLWPPALRERTAAYFAYQRTFSGESIGWPDLHDVLTRTSLRTTALSLMDSGADEQRAVAAALAAGQRDPLLVYRAALGALADRDYTRAERAFRDAEVASPGLGILRSYRTLALAEAGERGKARALLDETPGTGAGRRAFRDFFEKTFPP